MGHAASSSSGIYIRISTYTHIYLTFSIQCVAPLVFGIICIHFKAKCVFSRDYCFIPPLFMCVQTPPLMQWVQGMLDFDTICSREVPSVAAMVYPFSGNHKQKFYWGHKEIMIPGGGHTLYMHSAYILYVCKKSQCD